MDMVEYAKDWFEKSKRAFAMSDILIALLCAVTVIMIGVWLGLHNNSVIPPNPDPRYHYHSSDPLKLLANWDGPYYIAIAKHGYSSLLSAGFYPLYPLMIRALFYVLRSYLLGALFVSWTSLVGAIYFYIKIVRRLGLIDETSLPLSPVLLFILFPTAVFLIATYTEGLFAALALGSIYFSLKQRYILAGILLALATMTHVTGVFLVVLDILLLSEEKLPFKKIAFVAVSGISGASAYMIYLFVRFHNPLAFLESQTQIHDWFGSGYYHLIRSTGFLNLLFSVLLIVSAHFYWPKRKSFSVYSLLFLVIPIVGQQWGGFNRYVLMAFPIPLMIYEFLRTRRQTYLIIVVVSAVLWTYTLLQYVSGYIGS